MEVATLLLSNRLPKEIVLDEIYRHLCKLKKPISEHLKISIENNHFHLIKVVKSYHHNELYSQKENHPDYYAYWLENDLCSILNDGIPLILGVSVSLLKECPDITVEFLVKSIPLTHLQERIYELWSMMTYKKQMYMYRCSSVV